MRSCAHRVAALVSLMQCGGAAALDYQLHGYAAQGLIVSGGNNVFGDSTHTSTDYYEASLSGLLRPVPRLMLAAQGIVRDAGATDNGVPRLDFALADYQFVAYRGRAAGVRLGRVKNPMGFYNDTRDVVFTRPGIVMAAGVYNDSQNLRTLLFSSDGGQLYGRTELGAGHALSFTGTAAFTRNLDDSEKKLLADLGGAPFDLSLRDFWNAQLLDEIDDGVWRFGLSYLRTRVVIGTDPSIGIDGHVDLDIDVLSAQYNLSQLSLTFEYALQNQRTDLVAPSGSQQDLRRAEGVYLQADYRFTPQWSAFLRYDGSFSDRNDRDGRRYEAQTGADRREVFGHEGVAGGGWRYDQHWGVFAEYHLVYGTDSVQILDNQNRATSADNWSYLVLMAAGRF